MTATKRRSERKRAKPIITFPVNLLRVRRDERDTNVAHVALDSGEAQVIVVAHTDGTVMISIADGFTTIDKLVLGAESGQRAALAGLRYQKRLEQHFGDTLAAYSEGDWTKTPPTEGGTYFIASREGGVAGWVEVYPAMPNSLRPEHHQPRYLRFTQGNRYPVKVGNRPEEVHVGWWFSRPTPVPPSAPSWDE